MPPTRAPRDDRSSSAVTRVISGVPHAVILTRREDVRAYDVTIRNGVTGARFTGSLRMNDDRDADADDDSDARWRSTMDALTSAKNKEVFDVFDFALERNQDAEEDGQRSWDLVWRFSEEARAERFDKEEEEEEDDETVVKVERKSSKSGGKMRIGVLELREDETWDAKRCGMDALACAASAEQSEARANCAEARAKRLVLGAETSRRRADEAIEAMKETKEDVARRVMALLNAKKTEMRRMRETLDAAEAEVEDLNARLERARESGLANGTAPVEDGEGDDGGLTLFEEDDDGGEYTTDDEAHPTQRGERVSMRKRFGKQTQTQTQTQTQSQTQSRKRTKTAATKKQSTTTTRQKKSFLANTLALLDTE